MIIFSWYCVAELLIVCVFIQLLFCARSMCVCAIQDFSIDTVLPISLSLFSLSRGDYLYRFHFFILCVPVNFFLFHHKIIIIIYFILFLSLLKFFIRDLVVYIKLNFKKSRVVLQFPQNILSNTLYISKLNESER